MDSETDFNTAFVKLLKDYSLSYDAADTFLFVPYSAYTSFQRSGRFLIFEDRWVHNPEIIMSKIRSILSLSRKIHGRECTVKKISKPFADQFLIKNHILGTTNSKIKFGLYHSNELISLATFAGQRQFRNGGRSVELLRFCHQNNVTVTGGLDKLLQAYI